jgi:Domain of unknown function (DUF4214)
MTAAVHDGDGGVTTTTLEVLNAAAPVEGVAQTEITSHDLGTLLTGGGVLLYGAGTNTVQLADGALSVGATTTEAFLERLYQGLLGRADDVSGLSAWDVITSQQSLSSVAAGFLSSAEYTVAHPSQTNSDFVDNLYQSMLGRAGDAGGSAAWQTALDNGATRADVVVGFANSSEAKTALVDHDLPGPVRLRPGGTGGARRLRRSLRARGGGWRRQRLGQCDRKRHVAARLRRGVLDRAAEQRGDNAGRRRHRLRLIARRHPVPDIGGPNHRQIAATVLPEAGRQAGEAARHLAIGSRLCFR